MTVSIRLLGAFEISSAGVVVIGGAWRPAKAAALVKILALQRGHAMHRDQLIDLLWPEADTEAGSSSFYKNLHHLRAALRAGGVPDLIVLHRGGVVLHADAEVDVDVFRELARRASGSGEISLLEQALKACGGDLLPTDLYEAWSESQREELRALRERLQLELADRLIRRRRLDDAIHQYNDVLIANPLSEEAHRGLMRAYAMNGQRELAVGQYERCREQLDVEMGAAPSDETTALAAEIRRVDRLASAVDLAIEAPLRAADAAIRRREWPAAIDRCRDAIDQLRVAGKDEERESELWLKLATVTSANSGTLDVAEYCRRAADLAERSGSIELQARALVQFQAATDAIPNNHAGHREAAELIGAALERCPPGPSASRAWLLAAGARPAAASARLDDERHITGRVSISGTSDPAIEQRLREAVDIARAVGDPELLAYTLTRLRLYITSPDTLSERLVISEQLMHLQQDLSNPINEYEARLVRHEDLLEEGDLDGARIEARAIHRLGETLESNGMIAAAGGFLVTHATADGDLDQARALLFESRKLDAQRGDNSNTAYRFGIQLLMIRWHQGRIGELYEAYRRAVDLAPRLTAPRASLALICAESGRLGEARADLDHLADDSLAHIPRDYLWWLTSVFMTRVAIETNARETATSLYAMLTPYADRNASAAGAVSFGSASLFLGQLAGFLGDPTTAERHFEHALAFNVRTRQRVWTARTRYHYGMLLAEGDPSGVARVRELMRIALDDALEIGMPGLAADITRLPVA